jgi:hypothetical protein
VTKDDLVSMYKQMVCALLLADRSLILMTRSLCVEWSKPPTHFTSRK